MIKHLIFCFLLTNCLLAQDIHRLGVFGAWATGVSWNDSWGTDAYLFATTDAWQTPQAVQNNRNIWFLGYAEISQTYKTRKGFHHSLAYVYEKAYPLVEGPIHENRLYYQINYVLQFGERYLLKNRLRTDHRFFHNRDTEKSTYIHRIRYLVGIDIALTHKLSLTGYNEVFVSNLQRFEMDYNENWSFIGARLQILPNHYLETGPIYLTWKLPVPEQRLHLWYWFVQYSIAFNINKTQKSE